MNIKAIKTMFLFILVCVSFFECSRDATGVNNSGEEYSLSGNLLIKEKPIEDAVVKLDNSSDFKTLTDSSGFFKFTNVPKGTHYLHAEKIFDDGSFTQINQTINLFADLVINSMRLPNPVKMLEPNQIGYDSLRLIWTSTDAQDFREYKIYSGSTSGLDKNTGTLIHVTVARNDTAFIVKNLNPLSRYYFRVFAMNEFGKLGGSNIVSAITKSINYIWNGNFEIQQNIKSWWDGWSYGSFTYSDSLKMSGNYSLFMIADTINSSGNPYILANLNKVFDAVLLKNRWYKVSFWVKTSGPESDYGGDFWGTREEKAGLLAYDHFGVLGIPAETDWTYLEKTFYRAEQPVSLNIRSCSKFACFDNLKLELLPQ